MRRRGAILIFLLAALLPAFQTAADERLRVIIETDAGGDPDDEQSLVRFLLYSSEWDVQGIICTRPTAREGENLNPQRSGLGIVRAMLDAYGKCHPKLIVHDRRFPSRDHLWQLTVAGYDDTDDAVQLIIRAIDAPDPRPVWFCNWGTDRGSAGSNLKRALDRVRRERGQEGYAKFKNRLRLSSDEQFGEHTNQLHPPWMLWVDTFRPELERKRWYHRFSAITAKAGGFDVERDVRRDHGPLGALYPLNTTHPQKEGDTMSFLYLVPTGMNDPEQPTWGSWAGRYALRDARTHFWATAQDTWNGTTHRENSLARWAVHLQNDFKARMDWCVRDYGDANHPPAPAVSRESRREAKAGQKVELDAGETTDPDGDAMSYEWVYYPEPGSYRGDGVRIDSATETRASFMAPRVDRPETVHVVLVVTDAGDPPLTRYRRVVMTIGP